MYPREIRLGIVMYGGVSLAIYENGVAQEFYRAVRGDGIYALLKDLVQSDIVVDIISGTSAGGVNGILLAYALANGRDFSSVARLWRENGDIAKLLRNEHDTGTDSVLDSEGYYHEHLLGALNGMNGAKSQPASLPSETTELDLFVTGTNVHGKVQTIYDDLGHPVDVKDHRGVFKLAYRKGRKNDFASGAEEELARLARLTSCFPVAFAPVKIDSQSPRLREWGKLDGDAVFLDGGILDNKPFSYTIDAIFRRTADRDVERLLFYVEPDPEKFRQSSSASVPSVVTSATEALIGIPGYESIGDDLRSIANRNSQVARFIELLKCLPPPPAALPADALNNVAIFSPETSAECCLHTTCRLIQLRDRAIAGILNHGEEREFFSRDSDRRAGRILVNSFSLLDGTAPQTLESFDIYFRRRRLMHLTYLISDLLCAKDHPVAGETRAHYFRLWRTLNHLAKLAEILESAMERLVDYSDFSWRELGTRFCREDGTYREPDARELQSVCDEYWGKVGSMLSRLLDTRGITLPAEDSQAARVAFHKALAARVHSLPATDPAGNLLHVLDLQLVQAVRQFAASVPVSPVPQELCRYLEIDRLIFPLQLSSGVHSRDVLRVVRISPADAQREHSRRALEKKVCGKALGAFGGFFKMPWRSNDILWGRLDAVCQILECLFQRSRVRTVTSQEKSDLLAKVAQLLPNSDSATHSAIVQDLISLSTLDEERFQNLLNCLVRAAQDEIIAAEWKAVLTDALTQENEWAHHRILNNQAVPKGAFNQEKLSWVAAPSKTDALISALAAHAIAEDDLLDFDATDIAGRRFLDEIPAPVLFEVAALAALRLGRSLLASLPEKARLWVERRRTFKFVFRYLLPAIYRFARFQRTAPEWRVTSTVFLFTAGWLALLFGLLLLAAGQMRWTPAPSVYSSMILGSLVAIGLGWLFYRR